MEKKIFIEKYDEDFLVKVDLTFSVVDKKIVVNLAFDNQIKQLVFDESEFDENLSEEAIFDEKIDEIKFEVAYFYEPSPPIDEMSDFDFYSMKL